VVFLLNGVVFILIGLQLPGIVRGLGEYSLHAAILYGVVISLVAIFIRLAWVFPGAYLPRMCSKKIRLREINPGRKSIFVIGWSGMRGVVSLASALAIPLSLSGGATMTVAGDLFRIANGDLLDAEQAGVKVSANGQVVVDEYQRTTARGVFALGDVSSEYQLKHVANHEARVVKHNLLQGWDDTEALMPSDHRFVPSAVFTDPQIASVGLTENQARAKGFNIRAKVQDFGDVAYGWAMEDTTGIAKIVVDDDTGLILGAHIMGHQASSLIQPLIQAMSFDLPAQDMARGQYWIHPALPEVIENALLALCGEPPWPPSRRH